MMFLHYVLTPVAVLGMIGIVIFAVWADQRDKKVAVRQKALSEATNALRSLASVATKASKDTEGRNPFTVARAEERAYYYERVASIVASIPVDRL